SDLVRAWIFPPGGCAPGACTPLPTSPPSTGSADFGRWEAGGRLRNGWRSRIRALTCRRSRRRSESARPSAGDAQDRPGRRTVAGRPHGAQALARFGPSGAGRGLPGPRDPPRAEAGYWLAREARGAIKRATTWWPTAYWRTRSSVGR